MPPIKKLKSQRTPTAKKSSGESEVADDLSGTPDLPEDFLVVGIGASAGGIQALKEFFENVPADSGMAYVVILHLSPDHDSRLAEVLQQSAAIPVTQVKRRVRVEPNHVYVVPPNEHLTMTAAGDIEVSPNLSVEDRRAPVDIFFRTLAESLHARAVAVVLSGTGANGSMGIKRVKERGGAAFVQNPREAEFSEMPRNSIATDLIDRILNVAEIPAHIIGYKENLGTIKIPVEPESRPEEQQQALREIFTQLRLRTGHDFSNYKRATVLRRIERRINVRQLEDLPAYAAFVRENTDEATALLKDLLISVTNFFRDREAFQFLETDVLPKIFHGKRAEDTVRIWVAGCATGEEAYSMAMLCAERTGGVIDAPQVQIFASDIDEQAIVKAREGFYTLNDAADVAPERLRRFFTKENEGYRVRRDLREMVLFANHNILKDPAFSHLDAVTCRNMLIYLNPTAQERVMETFHFALEPGGFLLLGNSETVDGAGDLYATVSKEHHIFQSRHVSTRITYPIADSSSRAFRFDKMNYALAPAPPPPEQSETRPLERVSYGDLHLRLLEQYTPSVLINEQYDIAHISGGAARFLQMKAGEPTQNLLKLIVPELRLELRTALYQAAERQTNVEVKNLKIPGGERGEIINLYVRPVAQTSDDTARGFVLVLFETAREGDGGGGENRQAVYSQSEPMIGQLEEELVRSQSQLRRTVEQFEVQAEELKASNEELQAINEELRSSAEELETSKEELQSVNEELITVNQELKVKIEELSQSTSDFSNLINSTDIATIFLDRSFRVHTFTPAASRLFNLIPADSGRPISDITHRLEENGLIHDAETVLGNPQTIEREARTNDGHTYLMRVLPYRTADDRINGVVATFLNITERKRAEEAVRASEEKYRHVFNSIDEGFCVVEMIFDRENHPVDYLFLEINPIFERLTGLENAVGKTVRQFVPNLEAFWFEAYGRVALTGETERFENYSAPMNRWFDVHASRTGDEKSRRVVIVFNDITERKRREANLAFLADISQDLVRLTNIGGAINALGARIAEHFNVARVFLGEIDDHARTVRVPLEWHRGSAPNLFVEEFYNLDDFISEEFYSAARAGEIIVVGDTTNDSRTTKDESYAMVDTRSFVTANFVRDGKWLLVLSLTDPEPREWRTDETELIREITSRIWTRLERARAEELLRESQNQLRLALDAAELGTYLWYPQEDRTEPDARILTLLGLREGDTITLAEALAKMIHPDDRELYAAAIAAALDPNGDGKLDVDYRVIHLDGLLRWLHIYGQTFFEGENPPRASLMYGMVLDITTRKRTEANLAFLVETIADFAPLFRAEEIMERVGKRLADHLNLSRCNFAIVDEEADHIECLYAWRRDDSMPDLSGAHRISTFLSEEGRRHYAAGKFAVINDMRNSSLLNPATFEKFDELGLRSVIDMPYLKNGHWKFLLTAARSEASEWRADEIELIRELTERIYIRVERARAEEAMREAEEQYRTLFDSIDEGFCTTEIIFDEKGKAIDYRFLETNPAFERQTGIENAVGKRMRELVPQHEEFWFETYGQIAKTGEARRFEGEAAALGRIYDGYAFRVGEPEENRVAILFNDIGERKRIEEELRESEERLRLLIESASDYAIFTMSPDSLIDSWNTGAEKVFGWTEAEVLGKSGEILFTPEDREKGAPERETKTALRKGRAPDERFHIRKDGSRFYASGVMTVLKNDVDVVQGFAKIARDMTEQIEAEKALRDKEILQKLVGAQEDERKRIARDLHDELGQQLTALRLKLDAAKKMCKDEEVCDKIDEIELIAKSLDNGVDFLAWELRPAALDDLGLVAALDNYVRQWSHHSGVTAELLASKLKSARFAPEVETNLYRIVQEALNNTHKHAKAKSVVVMLKQRDGLLALLIEDNGKGFNPKNKKNKSKGLGLIGMKERAQLVGGELEIESAPGKGTTIFVRVPTEAVKRKRPDGE